VRSEVSAGAFVWYGSGDGGDVLLWISILESLVAFTRAVTHLSSRRLTEFEVRA